LYIETVCCMRRVRSVKFVSAWQHEWSNVQVRMWRRLLWNQVWMYVAMCFAFSLDTCTEISAGICGNSHGQANKFCGLPAGNKINSEGTAVGGHSKNVTLFNPPFDSRPMHLTEFCTRISITTHISLFMFVFMYSRMHFNQYSFRITNTISWYLARIINSYLLSLVPSW